VGRRRRFSSLTARYGRCTPHLTPALSAPEGRRGGRVIGRPKLRALFVAALLAALLLSPLAHAATDAAAPILRIETGMHGAVINRLAFADGGRELVTVSDDKTTRRWSLADGAALGVFRSPIGAGDRGALYAVAASGDTIVVGGRTGADDGGTLYLFNRATGAMSGDIPGFAQAISALAFAPDGKRLAVGQQGKGGIVLIDLAAGKMLGQDQHAQGGINWLAFAKDGTLAASAGDGKLRLYDAKLALTAEAALPEKDERPWGLAFAPDGATLAVGSATAGRVHLFDARLKLQKTLAGEAGRSGALSVVAWSGDGQVLAAAGSYKDERERRLIRFWTADAGAMAQAGEAEAARDTVTDLALLDGDRAVFVSAEPSLGIVSRSGKAGTFRKSADQADFRDAWTDAFRVSADGTVVEFPSARGGKDRFRFDLLAGTLGVNLTPRADLTLAVTEDRRLTLTDWRNGTQPRLEARLIALEPAEHVRSVAILPGARQVALGTDFYLRLAETGRELWRQVVAAPAWSVAATGDGRYLVAALGDGTIRWYATTDGREVMSLFVSPRDRRWVVWIPEGFFDHSHDPGAPSGETLVGYHLDKGPGKPADFISIAQLYKLFYRRDLVLAKFRGSADGARLVAEQLARIGDVRQVLSAGPPPRLDLIEACLVAAGAADCGSQGGTKPVLGARRIALPGAGTALFVRYRLTDRGGGLGRVIIRRDGTALEGERRAEGGDAKERRESVLLPLPASAGEVRFTTESASTTIRSREDEDLVLAVPPPPVVTTPPSDAEPQLYLVAIGVSAYRQSDFRLVNAANDARAVADLLNQPSPPVYRLAHASLLLDDDATGPNIAKALGDVASQARPQDIVVVFLSGHGDSVDGKYFFAPVDFAVHHQDEIARARKADERGQAEIIAALFRSDGFGEAQLLPLLEKIEGNLLLVLDTCFSATLADTAGEAERKARHQGVAQSVGHETGRFVLAGARDLALDSDGSASAVDGHGLFTAALLKGLEGDADFLHAGRVNVADLLRFTKTRVTEDSQKLKLDQEPFFFFNGTNFFDVRAVGKAP
jgi:WD40 repeat protein